MTAPDDGRHEEARGLPRANRRVSAGLRDRLGDNLRALRRARGLNQRALAARCLCNHRLISDLENSRRNVTLATLEMLAAALDCCESDLLRRGLPPGQPLRGGTPTAPVHPLQGGTPSARDITSADRDDPSTESIPPPRS